MNETILSLALKGLQTEQTEASRKRDAVMNFEISIEAAEGFFENQIEACDTLIVACGEVDSSFSRRVCSQAKQMKFDAEGFMSSLRLAQASANIAVD